MSDNEDWRRRKAEELGLVDTGPWLSHVPRPSAPAAGAATPRTPDAGPASAPTHGDAAGRTLAPIGTLSDSPDDAMDVDRRERAPPETPRTQSAASPARTSPDSTRHRGARRAAHILAIVAGLALALVLGWRLRGAAVPDDAPLALATTAAPSSGAAAPAPDPETASSDASDVAVAAPGTMIDSIPGPADARSPSAATSAPAGYAAATRPIPPTASPPTASSPRAEHSPADAQHRAARRARATMTTGEEVASRPVRPGGLSAGLPASRGRFTAPRAVAASGREFSPSFNCRRATSWVNRMVCNDEELAALDVRMSDAYGAAIAAAGLAGERSIDADQARFLGQRARCRTLACIDRAYRIRIDELAP